MPKRNIIWILVGGVVALLLWKVPEGLIRRDALYNKFGPLLDARVQVHKYYVDDVDDKKLLRGAIDGMLHHLDPYCAYYDPGEYTQLNQQTKGQFYGIGIELMRLPGEGLYIVCPIEGSPAFQAELRAGDRITAVGSESTESMPLPKAVELISGKPGTTVSLTIYRPATEETFTRTITRGLVTVRTVRGWARSANWDWDYMIDPRHRVGYVRISRFEGQTSEQFDEAVRDLLGRQGMRGLVIDLRDNPGGLLSAVVDVTDRLISEGKIVSTQRRVGPEQTFLATRENTYPQFPVVVLINRGSASAAEILAGALRDHHRATLVGERTFGKGSVQELIPLENNSGGIKLTAAYYLLPSGDRIHGRGVAPDHIVDLTPAERTEYAESNLAVYSTYVAPTTTQATTGTAPADSGQRVEIAIDRQLREALNLLLDELATRPATAVE